MIVEPTSGNQGIGLALVGAVKGYRTVIIMPDSVSEERRKLMEHYGAEVKLVHDDGNIGDCIEQCLKTALKMQAEDPNVFVPSNLPIRLTRWCTGTIRRSEILEQVSGPIHGFCSGVGTGGTISGIGEVLKAQNPEITIWAVEPEKRGNPVRREHWDAFADGYRGRLDPENLNTKIYNDICIVTDDEAISTAKDLARREGLMCGYRAGRTWRRALRLAKELGPGKTVVTVPPGYGGTVFQHAAFLKTEVIFKSC